MKGLRLYPNIFLLFPFILSWLITQTTVCFPQNAPPFHKKPSPSLLYWVEDIQYEKDLYIATFNQKAVNWAKIISLKNMVITRLDATHFLVDTPNHDYEPGTLFGVLDIERGTIQQPTDANPANQEVNLHLLRTMPKTKTAIFLQTNKRISASDLIIKDLDIAQNRFSHLITLSRDDLGTNVDARSLQPSPNGKYLLYSLRNDPPGKTSVPRTHTLKVLNIETNKTIPLAQDVFLEIAPISSNLNEWPAMQWLDNETILFQSHKPSNTSTLALTTTHQLKTINIHTKKINLRIQQNLRAKPGSGRQLKYNPFQNTITYRDKWLVDTKKWTLNPLDAPFTIIPPYKAKDSKTTTIKANNNRLYEGTEWKYNNHCIAPSRQHIAYSLKASEKSNVVKLFMKLKGNPKPKNVMTAHNCLNIKPVAWLEKNK